MPFDDAKAALNTFTYRPRWKRIDPPYRRGRYTVTIASKPRRYGHAISHGAKYSHQTRDVLFAWRDGKIVHTKAIWWCGGSTYRFDLTHDAKYQICEKCKFIKRIRRRVEP